MPRAKTSLVKTTAKPVSWRTKARRFDLDLWYPSENLKRNLGAISRAVYIQRAEISALGSAEESFVVIRSSEAAETPDRAHRISIDAAKAEWSSITAAVLFFDEVFLVHSPKHDLVVICRHPENIHPANRYKLSQIENIPTTVAAQVAEVVEVIAGLQKTVELMTRRFTDIWRASNLSVPEPNAAK